MGELIQNQLRTGLGRMERVVRDRMTTQDVEAITPQTLINIRPVVAALKEFFGTSQLQPVHGPDQPDRRSDPQAAAVRARSGRSVPRPRRHGGARRAHLATTAGCVPIETPEGPNIGLIGSLASFARVNAFGFVETPYRKVEKGRVTDQIDYLTADEEDRYIIAQANAKLDAKGKFTEERVLVRAPARRGRRGRARATCTTWTCRRGRWCRWPRR